MMPCLNGHTGPHCDNCLLAYFDHGDSSVGIPAAGWICGVMDWQGEYFKNAPLVVRKVFPNGIEPFSDEIAAKLEELEWQNAHEFCGDRYVPRLVEHCGNLQCKKEMNIPEYDVQHWDCEGNPCCSVECVKHNNDAIAYVEEPQDDLFNNRKG